MKITRFRNMAVAFVLTSSLCGATNAEELNPKGLPSQVRSIFVAKCSECHGRGLSRPRAALYLHELGQLAANREWVVPYEPENSYLWTLVRNDDMPAKGAKAGPLNDQEKETIRAWIAAGAPVPAVGTNLSLRLPQESPRTDNPAPEAASPSLATRLFGWLGKFHILVIHFPIGLLVAAALGELLAVRRGTDVPEPAVHFCVLLGAAGAVAAAALGWLHADLGGHGSASNGILGLHRWLGTMAALCAVGIALASVRDSQHGQRSALFRVLLGGGAILVAATAHFGGVLAHGNSFFEW